MPPYEVDNGTEPTIARIQELKKKYSEDLKDSPDNPIRVCMKLIFEGATERDTEKRLASAHNLSEYLTKPNGIMNLFMALIDFDTSSQKFTTHNQRFIAVSNIISCLPKLCMPYDEYCKNICKQLKPLLIDQNRQYSSLAAIIIKSLIESPLVKEDVGRIIVAPILSGLDDSSSDYKPEQAIVAIHNLVDNHVPVDLFIDRFPHLFSALITLNNTSSSDLSYMIRTILVSVIRWLEPGAACCLMEKTLFHSDSSYDLYKIFTSDDRVSIELTNDKIDAIPDKSILKKVVLNLLEQSDSKLLLMEFFFHFQEIIWRGRESRHRELSAYFVERLLEENSHEESDSRYDLFSIIVSNQYKATESIMRTLINHKAFLESHHQNLTSKFKLVEQSMTSCISILEVLCATMCDKEDTSITIAKFASVLGGIHKFLIDNEIMVSPLIKSIESFCCKLRDIKIDNLEESSNSHSQRECDLILKDLNNKLVPVRVHALVKLKQMILAGDSYAISRIPELYTMIECSLSDKEPYVFLACINLLAEMSLRNTSCILPKLLNLYSRQDLELQNRINVGEVLIRLVKQMNQTTPFYAQQVMDLLLSQCKDPEELIRMSSLTNIGEICKSLGDSIGKYIVEILSCVRAIVISDTIQVKCAAIDLLRTTLSGFKDTRIEPLQIELKEMYRVIKQARQVTLDDKLCLQIDLAMDEMDRIARELYLGHPMSIDNFTKNIKVLSLMDKKA